MFFLLINGSFGFTEDSLRMNIRWSARFSLIYFCVAFSASSFHVALKKNTTQWILENRKYFGISFAIIHLIHLFFLFLLHLNFHAVFIKRSLTEISLGGLAYVFTILMLMTSFDRGRKRLSMTQWNSLHTIGGYWILIVFSNSIIGRVLAGKIEYLPLAIIIMTVWCMRFISWRKNRLHQNSA